MTEQGARPAGLLAWYRQNQRTLPWRRDRDPYRVMVSEAMLQQTRVAAVLPRYDAWLRRFPTVADLAGASEQEVVDAWAGLGYYQRARRLHKAAQAIHALGWPTDMEGLRALPGFGPYTAAAVGSIAFGHAVAVVDGNVERVLARTRFTPTEPERAWSKAALQREAEAWLQSDGRRDPGAWNQAVMELGATVCLPRSPRCDACPEAVARTCGARLAACQDQVPPPKRKAAAEEHAVHLAAVVRRGKLLLVRRPPGLLGGMLALPEAANAQDLERRVGAPLRHVGRARHVFTHRVWDMHVYAAAPPRSRRRGPTAPATAPAGTWHAVADLATLPLPTATRKALAAAGFEVGL